MAMQNIRKGPPELYETLKMQAELTNLPRIGTDDNVAHPNFQLNMLSAKEGVQSTALEMIGKRGKIHADVGDSVGCDTSLMTLSKAYDGVYEDYFYLHDLRVAWELQRFSTISFSGLHPHSGSQPKYRPDRKNSNHIHYRLTLVGYSPESSLDGSDAVAFAALPTGALLPVGYDMRFPLM